MGTERSFLLTTKLTIWTALGISALASLSPACTGSTTDADHTPAAKTYQLSAAMDTHQVVSPKNKPWKAPAKIAKTRGTFTGSLDGTSGKLTWHITYSGLQASQPPIADDIHFGERGHFGAILVRLCSPCDPGGQSGVATVKTAYIANIASGATWVTVITQEYPNGVIRGQVEAQ
jgi:hypothetical protein